MARSAPDDSPEQESAHDNRDGGQGRRVLLCLLLCRFLRTRRRLLRARLHIGLRSQRRGGLAQVVARVFDLAPDLLGTPLLGLYCRADLALVFTHATSSFV